MNITLKVIHKTESRVRFSSNFANITNFSLFGRKLEAIDGIKNVRINQNAKSLIIEFDNSKLSIDSIIQKIKNLKIDSKDESEDEHSNVPLPLLKAGSALALSPFLPASLNAVSTTFASFHALSSGAKLLFTKGVTSEVLEAVAIGLSIYRKDFIAANVTNSLIELAELIESNIERKSEKALRALLKPNVEQVWIKKDGNEILIDSNDLKQGDILIAHAGETIAADGVVSEGEALVNEVSLTGESLPVRKMRGDKVISGTQVTEGAISIWAEHVGSDTVTFRISEYVQSSLETKSKMQAEASKLADSLVPMTLGLGALSYAATRDLNRVAAVFQADYSCALKLATPVSFRASMYQAGTHGMLIKSADALERLAEADTFVFDKTGTLTSGNLEVTDVYSLNKEWSKDEILNLAASIEEHYFHPLAEAVVKAAKETSGFKHFHHSHVEFIVAHGVCAEVNGKKVVIGSRHFLEDDESISFDGQNEFINEQYEKGLALLYIGFDGKLLGVITLKDSVREETKQTIERLRELGAKHIVMLTGDHKERAKEMAERLNLDEYRYELLPQDKASIIEEFKNSGRKVAFIGDGINDAPSLAGASVGIAMQKGADIARVSSDIALLEDSLSKVADAKEIANKAIQMVKNNYKFTIGANSAILGAAALGLLSPVATSILHNGATVGILLNATRGAKLKNDK